MEITNQLITGGVNPIYNCVAIKNNIALYGCSNQIYVYDLFNKTKVVQTLKGHKKRMNTIKFLENTEFNMFVSGSSDGQIFIWQNKQQSLLDVGYEIVQKIQVKDSVQFISVKSVSQGVNIIAIGDSQGEVSIFKYTDNNNSLEQIDQLTFPQKSLIETIDMYLTLNQNKQQLIIAMGSLDFLIHTYILNLENNKLQYHLSLKGHTNAITSLAFKEFVDPTNEDIKYLLLASSSKYNFIRLYKFQLLSNVNNLQSYDQKTSFTFNKDHLISLESVLYGHTDTVVSLSWGLSNLKGNIMHETDIALISASFDFSIIIWTYEDNIWLQKIRLGQVSGNKHAFFDAKFSSDYREIIAYTYTGAFNIWRRINDEEMRFTSLHAISGNISYVTDLDWSSDGSMIVTSSQDQTSRVYGQNQESMIWNEYSRSQIHGYDINSIKMLTLQNKKDDRKFCDAIICGADEKVLRLLEPPTYFLNYMNTQCGTQLRLYVPDIKEEDKFLDKKAMEQNKGKLQYLTQTEGGLQVLGLMTKQVQVYKQEIDIQGLAEEGEEESTTQKRPKKTSDELIQEEEIKQQEKIQDNQHNYQIPPCEDFLEKHTLWPELNKFYGHGYEISCVSSNYSGTTIVSACKSQTQDQSVILFYDPQTYAITQKLQFHNYTVMQLEFSHNDQILGSVSRDRQFSLFRKNQETKQYESFFSNQSHTRIIWSLSFSCDDQYVITGGRDKRIKIWKINGDVVEKVFEKLFKSPVTAVAFSQHSSQTKNNEKYSLVSLGFENSEVQFYQFFGDRENEKERLVELKQQNNENKLSEIYCHSSTIKRIKFRKFQENQQTNEFYVASCSNDHSMRINKITVLE